MTSLCDIVPSGVVTGDDLVTLLDHARANSYAIPAVNCTRYVISNDFNGSSAVVVTEGSSLSSLEGPDN